MRLVLDTNVVVAAMRSPSGASAALLRLARQNKLSILANVALALEYEAICTMPEHVVASGLTGEEAEIFVDAVVALCEPVETHFLWRPQLRDPADEFVLDAAVNGQARAIVTFNKRDFAEVETGFGIELATPSEALRSIKS